MIARNLGGTLNSVPRKFRDFCNEIGTRCQCAGQAGEEPTTERQARLQEIWMAEIKIAAEVAFDGIQSYELKTPRPPSALPKIATTIGLLRFPRRALEAFENQPN
jgi:hypothetical protein